MREMQFKTTVRYHLTPGTVVIIKKDRVFGKANILSLDEVQITHFSLLLACAFVSFLRTLCLSLVFKEFFLCSFQTSVLLYRTHPSDVAFLWTHTSCNETSISAPLVKAISEWAQGAIG